MWYFDECSLPCSHRSLQQRRNGGPSMTLILESHLEEASLVMSTWRERRGYAIFFHFGSFNVCLSHICLLVLLSSDRHDVL